MERNAIFDKTGTFRYLLTRYWDRSINSVLFIMLNPSTANSITDDPTIRRCMNFSKLWGYGGIEVVNLFALVSSDPAKLLTAQNSIGVGNDSIILSAAVRAEKIIAAWGAFSEANVRSREVLVLLNSYDIYCLGTTQRGHPKHPLYLQRDLKPRLYSPLSKRESMVER